MKLWMVYGSMYFIEERQNMRYNCAWLLSTVLQPIFRQYSDEMQRWNNRIIPNEVNIILQSC